VSNRPVSQAAGRRPHPRHGRHRALASLVVEALLLFDGALSSGNRLKPLIRNRLTALHGETIGASGKPLLSMLDSRQLGQQIIELRGFLAVGSIFLDDLDGVVGPSAASGTGVG
jgi:hypothetical protein